MMWPSTETTARNAARIAMVAATLLSNGSLTFSISSWSSSSTDISYMISQKQSKGNAPSRLRLSKRGDLFHSDHLDVGDREHASVEHFFYGRNQARQILGCVDDCDRNGLIVPHQ